MQTRSGLFGFQDNQRVWLIQNFNFPLRLDLRNPTIVMHDILKQMGREIVRQENVDYPGKCSRLWDCKDTLEVLKNCKVRSTLANFSLTFDIFFLYFFAEQEKYRKEKKMTNKGN